MRADDEILRRVAAFLIEPARAPLDRWVHELLVRRKAMGPGMFGRSERGAIWLTKEGRATFYPLWFGEGHRIALPPMRSLLARMLSLLRRYGEPATINLNSRGCQTERERPYRFQLPARHCHGKSFRLEERIYNRAGSGGQCGYPPMLHRLASEPAKRVAGEEVTLNVEGVVDGGVAGEEALR